MSATNRGARRRLLTGAAALAGLGLTLSGCGFHGLYSANLPGSVGGPFSSAKTYTVTASFANVLDLVPQSAVKVDDVTVGTVENVTLVPDPTSHAYVAKVVMHVKRSTVLPANTTAVLEETSLLGEKFVELASPTTGAQGRLADNAVIPNTSTTAYPDIEQVFGVLSGVLNGGGLAKLQTINTEVSAALAGRENQVHDVLSQLSTFVGGLNGSRDQIVRAIDQLDVLSGHLRQQDGTIALALNDIGPGLKVLADERANLTSLLVGLSNLGVVSNRVINASTANTKADLQLLEPVLTQLSRSGKNLSGSLELLADFPFADKATSAIKGDSTNLYLTVNLCSFANVLPSQLGQVTGSLGSTLGTLQTVLGQLGIAGKTGTGTGDCNTSGSTGSGTGTSNPLSGLLGGGLPSLPSLPGVPSLPSGAAATPTTPSAPSTALLDALLGGATP